jgi:hypothetical protein
MLPQLEKAGGVRRSFTSLSKILLPFLLISSAQASYPALTHFAYSEANLVRGKDPPILVGSPAGARVLVVWLKTGAVAQIKARKTRKMITVFFFMIVLLFQSLNKM